MMGSGSATMRWLHPCNIHSSVFWTLCPESLSTLPCADHFTVIWFSFSLCVEMLSDHAWWSQWKDKPTATELPCRGLLKLLGWVVHFAFYPLGPCSPPGTCIVNLICTCACVCYPCRCFYFKTNEATTVKRYTPSSLWRPWMISWTFSDLEGQSLVTAISQWDSHNRRLTKRNAGGGSVIK